MVIDGLVPVITPEGVGTIVTMNGHNVLTEGMEYHKATIEAAINKDEDQWLVTIHGANLSRWWDGNCRLYVTKETMFKTPDGWCFAKDLTIGGMVRALFVRCLVCQKPYFPKRPILNTCSNSCLEIAKKAGILCFRPINAQTAPAVLEERWATVVRSKYVRVWTGNEVIKVSKLENADSLYVASVLISSEALQNRV